MSERQSALLARARCQQRAAAGKDETEEAETGPSGVADAPAIAQRSSSEGHGRADDRTAPRGTVLTRKRVSGVDESAALGFARLEHARVAAQAGVVIADLPALLRRDCGTRVDDRRPSRDLCAWHNRRAGHRDQSRNVRTTR
jgi:hypothetical protein